MRMIVGVLSLLLVLATVGLLVKKQMGGTSAGPATVQLQSQQLPEQTRQAVEATLQQARPMPDDK